ncbi:metallophosphoesterase family protein [Nocardioides sp. Leaf285]|uniref:metallophosphoesterase family protein n=1 Tax=Nocardioides sp. Leaf285 TaxID=1736322 RepID=UPI0007029AC4|nr:metallophosphoesterase [Nocardioides sp. Leaf285]KQP63180.1 hypothetical protein ASF47_19410 [Nocardioides sp. Leaf285]
MTSNLAAPGRARTPRRALVAVLAAFTMAATCVASNTASSVASTATASKATTGTKQVNAKPPSKQSRDDVTARPTVEGVPTLPGAYRFASAPDFLNQDVADVSGMSGYRGGPNGTNSSYEDSLAYTLGQIAQTGAEDLFVAGDLVEGSWGLDKTGSGVFGPAETNAQRKAAARRAAEVYYTSWRARVRAAGMEPYPAVGDHEMGDNPWTSRGRTDDYGTWLDWKRRNQTLFKDLFGEFALNYGPDPVVRRTSYVSRPTSGPSQKTAYASLVDPTTLLVTIDVFHTTPDGSDVVAKVDDAQLAWLESVLANAQRAGIPWVIVQGHTPIVVPVRTRFSSALKYQGGTNSALWRLMDRYNVDFYFSGEVHDHTVAVANDIIQMSHGALFYRGEFSFVRGQATNSTMSLETHLFEASDMAYGNLLWSTEGGNGPEFITYDDPSRVVGTLVVERGANGRNTITRRTGISLPFYG